LASIHKQSGRPHYFAAFSVWDPATDERSQVFWSTRTANKRKAQRIADSWERAAKAARKIKRVPAMNAKAERAMIARGVEQILRAAGLA